MMLETTGKCKQLVLKLSVSHESATVEHSCHLMFIQTQVMLYLIQFV